MWQIIHGLPQNNLASQVGKSGVGNPWSSVASTIGVLTEEWGDGQLNLYLGNV